jgi:hypothetical protein
MRFVTSFGPEGWRVYGRRFLESYVEHVDKPIDVYVEEQPDFKHDLVTFRDLFKTEGCRDFLKIANFPAAHGFPWGEEKYNYRYATFKFARKTFAQVDAASRNPGLLFWIDSDVEFFGKFDPPTDFEFMAYLGRPEWHSCASFVGWDTRHPAAGEFFKRYWLLHVTGTVFCLPEWHDSFVLDWMRQQTKCPAVNLAAGLELKGPANVFDEVFGPVARHKKGMLKYEAA